MIRKLNEPDITYKTYRGPQIVEGAHIALDSKLFLVGGFMIDAFIDELTLQHIPQRQHITVLVIVQYQQLPVGACVIQKNCMYWDLMVFVNKEYRRHGLGTELCKRAKHTLHGKHSLVVCKWNKVAAEFFNHLPRDMRCVRLNQLR